jgi:hypothetical protein
VARQDARLGFRSALTETELNEPHVGAGFSHRLSYYNMPQGRGTATETANGRNALR